MSEKPSENNVARLKAEAEREPIARFLDMRLVELEPGHARVAIKLRPEYQTFNGVLFGGIVMAVADQAFAYAVNSQAHPSIAADFHIQFISGAAADDELVAECRVVRNGRHIAFSEMTVTNQDGKLIAKASGITARVTGA